MNKLLVMFLGLALIGCPKSDPPSPISVKIHRECESKREGMTSEGWNACLIAECQEWGGSWQDGECKL